MTFYFVLDCPRCGDEITYGPCCTGLETPSGAPMVPLSMGEHFSAECDGCGARMHIGERDLTVEEVKA